MQQLNVEVIDYADVCNILAKYDKLRQYKSTVEERRLLSNEIYGHIKKNVDQCLNALDKLGLAWDNACPDEQYWINHNKFVSSVLQTRVIDDDEPEDEVIGVTYEYKRAMLRNAHVLYIWIRHLMHRRPQLSLSAKKKLFKLQVRMFKQSAHCYSHDKPDSRNITVGRLSDNVPFNAVYLLFIGAVLPLPGDLEAVNDALKNDDYTIDIDGNEDVLGSTIQYYSSSLVDYVFDYINEYLDLRIIFLELMRHLVKCREGYLNWRDDAGISSSTFIYREQDITQYLIDKDDGLHLPAPAIYGGKYIWPFMNDPFASLPHSTILTRVLCYLLSVSNPLLTYKQCLDSDKEKDEPIIGKYYLTLKGLDKLSNPHVYRRAYGKAWEGFIAASPIEKGLRRDDKLALINLLPCRTFPYITNVLQMTQYYWLCLADPKDTELKAAALQGYYHMMALYKLNNSYSGDENVDTGLFEFLAEVLQWHLLSTDAKYYKECRKIVELALDSPSLSKEILLNLVGKLLQISQYFTYTSDLEWVLGVVSKMNNRYPKIFSHVFRRNRAYDELYILEKRALPEDIIEENEYNQYLSACVLHLHSPQSVIRTITLDAITQPKRLKL